MSDIAKAVGQRIRNYRTKKGLSQEKLAELSGCHPTYIGQLERGEKNATLESIERITAALGISLSKLFEKLDGQEDGGEKDIPLACYEFLSAKSKEEQEQLYTIVKEMHDLGVSFFFCGFCQELFLVSYAVALTLQVIVSG